MVVLMQGSQDTGEAWDLAFKEIADRVSSKMPAANIEQPPARGDQKPRTGLWAIGDEELGVGDQDRRRIRTHVFAALDLDFVDKHAIQVGGRGAISCGAGIGCVLEFDAQRVGYTLIVDRAVIQELRHVVNDALRRDHNGEGYGSCTGVVYIVGGDNRKRMAPQLQFFKQPDLLSVLQAHSARQAGGPIHGGRDRSYT